MTYSSVVTIGAALTGGTGQTVVQTTVEESSDLVDVPSVISCPKVNVPHSVQSHKHLSLSQGETTVSVPTGTVGALIIFPSPGNTPPTLELRFVTQVSGLSLNNQGAPFGPVFFGTTPSQFILYSSATLADVLILFF